MKKRGRPLLNRKSQEELLLARREDVSTSSFPSASLEVASSLSWTDEYIWEPPRANVFSSVLVNLEKYRTTTRSLCECLNAYGGPFLSVLYVGINIKFFHFLML